MKCFLSSLSLLAAVLFARHMQAADEHKPAKKPAGAVKVLILSGVPETHHDYKNQCPNLAKVLKEQGHDVTLRDQALIEEEDRNKFDVFVLMSEKWRGDEKNRQELLQLVKDGTGLVVIHMAYVPCVEALGGKASRNGKTGDLKIEIVDKKHSITQGVNDFTAGPNDQLYAGVKFTVDDVQVLAKGQDTAGTWEPVAWVRLYGKGCVFYTSLGHSTPSQQNPAFLKLVTTMPCAGPRSSSPFRGYARVCLPRNDPLDSAGCNRCGDRAQ